MIQEIAPHSFDNAFRGVRPAQNDLTLVFDGDRVLCAQPGGEIALPRWGELDAPEASFGFVLDGAPVFLAEGPCGHPPAYEFAEARALRYAGPPHLAWAIGVGGSLLRWYRANRFCGACGAAMAGRATERAMVCPRCGLTVYPRISPAVIVAVCDGPRLLLTRYRGRPFQSYALVAGFNEIGESIEDTVRREVWEETGLRVKNLRFYRSQPWVFTDSLLMGFFADLDGPDTVTVQESELAEAGWFRRSDIPDDHSPISLTGEMIEVFRSEIEVFRSEGE